MRGTGGLTLPTRGRAGTVSAVPGADALVGGATAAAMGAAGFILAAMGYPKLYFGLPLQAFLFLVALGVDYSIFLMTRAREEVATLGHRRGVLHAVTVTGGVITSAGVVPAATFASLSVLLDTFLVRSLLVPALALHIGPAFWWPGRPAAPVKEPAPDLGRLLPL
jgi:RND superfamily putative drug exporter